MDGAKTRPSVCFQFVLTDIYKRNLAIRIEPFLKQQLQQMMENGYIWSWLQYQWKIKDTKLANNCCVTFRCLNWMEWSDLNRILMRILETQIDNRCRYNKVQSYLDNNLDTANARCKGTVWLTLQRLAVLQFLLIVPLKNKTLNICSILTATSTTTIEATQQFQMLQLWIFSRDSLENVAF